jgi:hypothetical protein
VSFLVQRALGVLGVPRGASLREIEQARRKALFRHHPDRGGDPVAFRQAQEAYELLVELHATGGLPPASAPIRQGRRRRRSVQLGGPVQLPPRRVDPGYYSEQQHLEAAYGSGSSWSRDGVHRGLYGAHVKRRRKG